MSDANRPYGGPPDGELVTGDAVVLDVRLAQLPTRAMSIGIDIVVQLAMLVGLGLLLGAASSQLDDAATAALSLVLVVAVIVGYPVAFETLSRGRTLGKMAFGLRVVRDDGGPERFRQALFRGLAEVVEVWLTFGVIAVFASLFSSRGKRVGDVFSGTVVVRERMPSQGGPVAWMPPALVPWAAGADLSRVPDALALQARQMLARWHDLDPASRDAMAARLATDVARFVAPPSPPGTSAPDYLSAVLVERRRRDQHRLAPPAAAVRPPAPAPRPTQQPPAAPPPDTRPPAEESSTGGFSVPR